MKLRRTHQNKRTAYIYDFGNGQKTVLRAGVDGVTEEDILELHRFDDREVKNNLKNSKPKRMTWQKRADEEWKAKHPDEDLPSRWAVSVEQLLDEGDFENRLPSIEPELSIEALSETMKLEKAIEKLNIDQKKLVQQIFFHNEKISQIAEKQGVTSAAIHSRLKKIYKKIEKNFE